jgi:hypothetical protein
VTLPSPVCCHGCSLNTSRAFAACSISCESHPAFGPPCHPPWQGD